MSAKQAPRPNHKKAPLLSVLLALGVLAVVAGLVCALALS